MNWLDPGRGSGPEDRPPPMGLPPGLSVGGGGPHLDTPFSGSVGHVPLHDSCRNSADAASSASTEGLPAHPTGWQVLGSERPHTAATCARQRVLMGCNDVQ